MPKRLHKPGKYIPKDEIEVGDVIRFHLWNEPNKFSLGLVSKIEPVGGLKERHFINEAGVVLNNYPDQVMEARVVALAAYEPTEEEKRKDAKFAEFDKLWAGTTFVRVVDGDVVINTKIGNDSWTDLTLYEDGEQGFDYTYDYPLFEELYDGNTSRKPVT